jgi:putative acetyltransferase
VHSLLSWATPEFYPRFGFEQASLHSIRSQWEEVPDDAFMVLILDHMGMAEVSGIARYRGKFDEVM